MSVSIRSDLVGLVHNFITTGFFFLKGKQPQFVMREKKTTCLDSEVRVKKMLAVYCIPSASIITVMTVAAVHEACKEVFRSRKLKRLLELVLACGNYMNRGQRGNALGFQPASLNKMLDTRSSASKQVTLLHYVVETLEKKVPWNWWLISI